MHEKYIKVSSPFGSSDLDKDVLIELLTTYIVFWTKYPYSIKKSLFMSTIMSTGVSTNLFQEIPLFEILGSEHLLLEALKSKVPFNINVLNNVAIAEFIMEG